MVDGYGAIEGNRMKRSYVCLSALTMIMMLFAVPALAAKGGVKGPPEHAQGNGQSQEAKPEKSEKSERPTKAQSSSQESASVVIVQSAPKSNGANQSGDFDARPSDGVRDEGGHEVGSKGKADDKNPPGQSRNDHNNGYECDGNKGIGDGGGNPAHTGCADRDKPVCEKNCNPCKVNCNPCEKDCDPPCKVDCEPPCEEDCEPVCVTDCGPPPGCQGICAPPIDGERLPDTGIAAPVLALISLMLLSVGGVLVISRS